MKYDKLWQIIERVIKPNLKNIHKMRVGGLSEKYIAKGLGISISELRGCIEENEMLRDVWQDATEILCGELSNIVVGRALGTDGRLDSEGNVIPADEKLAFKLLEKFDNRYKNKGEIGINIAVTHEERIELGEMRARLELEKERIKGNGSGEE